MGLASRAWFDQGQDEDVGPTAQGRILSLADDVVDLSRINQPRSGSGLVRRKIFIVQIALCRKRSPNLIAYTCFSPAFEARGFRVDTLAAPCLTKNF